MTQDEPPAPASGDAASDEISSRLTKLEAAAEATEGKFKDVWISFAMVAGGIVLALGLYALADSREPAYSPASPADDTEEMLLKSGPHCYGSIPEAAAARQRALSAADRIVWDNDHRPKQDEVTTQMWGVPPPTPVPRVSAVKAGEEGKQCFDIDRSAGLLSK